MRRVIRDDGREYPSITQAARETHAERGSHGNPDLQVANIHKACKSGKTVMGHTWRFADDDLRTAAYRNQQRIEELESLVSDMWELMCEIPLAYGELGDIPERVRKAVDDGEQE